jgi:hypothetical protein
MWNLLMISEVIQNWNGSLGLIRKAAAADDDLNLELH